MLAVGDLSGSGGAERQFGDLFDHLRRQGRHVTLITSTAAVKRLRAARRLQSDDRVVSLPLGDRPAAGVVGTLWAMAQLLLATVGRGFDLVHIALPTPSYVPYLATLRLLPRALRSRTSITVIDCTLAENLRSGQVADAYRAAGSRCASALLALDASRRRLLLVPNRSSPPTRRWHCGLQTPASPRHGFASLIRVASPRR